MALGEAATLKDLEPRAIQQSPENSREQKLDKIIVDEDTAKKLMETREIKIGWINCRIREKVQVLSCHKRPGSGLLQSDCWGPDQAQNCLKDGGNDR